MLRLLNILLILPICLQKSVNGDQTVVKNFKVEKYMGRWYQIAAFPTAFMRRNSVNTRATYTLNSNGSFHVLNESWDDGRRVSIEGITYKVDPKSDEAKFKVTFNRLPVTGDYWILYVDVNYVHALVGHPSMDYLWILNRQPQLDDLTYNQLVGKAKGEGYDVSRLEKTSQSNNPPSQVSYIEDLIDG